MTLLCFLMRAALLRVQIAYMIRRSVTFVLKTCIEHLCDSALVFTWSMVSVKRSGGCFDKAQSGCACGRGHCD